MRPVRSSGKLQVRPDRDCKRPIPGKRHIVLLILGIVLLVIAIAGGAIVQPVLFALGIVALVLFFTGR